MHLSRISRYLWIACQLFCTIVFRQDASNNTHDDLNEPTLQSDPGYGQGHYITMDFIMCGVTPPKWAVLPMGVATGEDGGDVSPRLESRGDVPPEIAIFNPRSAWG